MLLSLVLAVAAAAAVVAAAVVFVVVAAVAVVVGRGYSCFFCSFRLLVSNVRLSLLLSGYSVVFAVWLMFTIRRILFPCRQELLKRIACHALECALPALPSNEPPHKNT